MALHRPVPKRLLQSVSESLVPAGLLIALVMSFTCPELRAATPTSAHYFTHLWQSENGLPQNAVTAIVQTHDGYLWLGTYSGLVRFDGVRFTVFANSNTPELQSSRVTSLFEDAARNLWIGHETGGLTRFKDGRFETMEVRAAWEGGKIFAICADSASDIWLVHEEGLIGRLRDGLVLTPRAGIAKGVICVATDTEGTIWILRDGKVSALKNGKLSSVDFEGDSADTYVQGICSSRKGGFWVASDERLRRWKKNQWAENLGQSPWGVSATVSFIETQDGSLAAGTVDSGLYLVNPHIGALHFNRTNGLPQNWVRSLCEDREGNLWIGAGSGGLVALRAGKVATISPPDNWQGRAVLSVSMSKDGAMWIGTEGAGLYRLQESLWTRFAEEEGLSNPFIWSVSEDQQGRLWAGTWGGGLFIQRGDRFERVPGLENLSAPTPALLHTPDAGSWVGTADGLLRYESSRGMTWFGRQQGLEFPDVRAIVRSSNGIVWFGMSGGGLGRLKDGAVRQFRKRDGLSSDDVNCLRLDPDGTLWIGTSGGGLNRLTGERFAVIGTRQGLPNSIINHIQEDERGFFWMSSHGGILRVSKAELNRCADGETDSVNCLTYGKGDGLPTLECSGSGCKTADGTLWFPTTKGLVSLNPNDVKNNQLPPPVVIEEVLVEGQPVNGSGPAASLRIPRGRQRFEFHYTGLSFTVPEKVRFKYRLEGLEPEWVDAGPKRAANYSYIPPGDYTFRVIACNNDGVWNESGAELAFTVSPHFWQTWWLRGLAGLGAAAVVGGSVLFETRRRMRGKLERVERQRAVERERTRIARDIHDDLGASLTRITLLSQSARSELDDPARAAADLDKIYDTARELTRAMDEIVWAINPRHDTLDSLATYLGKFAQDFLGAGGIRCRLRLPVQLPPWPLTAEVRHNLFLAFKESLNNVVKHAAATEVQISLKVEPTGFVLSVKDDGCGFPLEWAVGDTTPNPACFTQGNGLGNMRQRLKEISGECEIKSAPRAGTNVTFKISVP